MLTLEVIISVKTAAEEKKRDLRHSIFPLDLEES